MSRSVSGAEESIGCGHGGDAGDVVGILGGFAVDYCGGGDLGKRGVGFEA